MSLYGRLQTKIDQATLSVSLGYREPGKSKDERKHMKSDNQTAPISKTSIWAGRVLSALPVLNLLIASALKLMNHRDAVEGFAKLGFPEGVALKLGILELACTVIYVIPQTSVLGAILLTGYLGGAVVTHVRVGDTFSNIITPVFLGDLVWGGLFLRDLRLGALIRFCGYIR